MTVKRENTPRGVLDKAKQGILARHHVTRGLLGQVDQGKVFNAIMILGFWLAHSSSSFKGVYIIHQNAAEPLSA
jgi:hypothetical protein